VAAFKLQVADLLKGLVRQRLAEYEWRHVSYGRNVQLLVAAGDETKNDINLSALGVVNKSLILISAPPQIKPRLYHKRPEPVDDKQSTEFDDEKRFAGLSPKNIWTKLKASAGQKRKLFLEYIDRCATRCLAGAAFLQADKKLVKEILARDKLAIEELALFEALLKWGRHQLGERKEKEEGKMESEDENKDENKDKENKLETKSSLRLVIDDLIPIIRFPLMTPQHIAIVQQSDVLNAEELLELYTYLNTPVDRRKILRIRYSTKPRQRSGFIWSALHRSASVIVQDNRQIVSQLSGDVYSCVAADVELRPGQGVTEWELKVDSHDANYGDGIKIGVVRSDFGFSSFENGNTVPGSWFYCPETGDIAVDSVSTGSAEPLSNLAQSIFHCRFDSDPGTLTLWRNDQLLVTFTSIKTPVRPALSMIGQQRVSLIHPCDERTDIVADMSSNRGSRGRGRRGRGRGGRGRGDRGGHFPLFE